MTEPSHIEIRVAEVDDVAASAALAFAHSGRTIDDWTASLAAIRSRRDAELFVAIVGASVVGYGKLQWHDWTADPIARNVEPGWHLSGLVVAPDWRRRGVGVALTRARIAWLRDRDRAAVIWYCANARNDASLALHASLGFREVSRDFVIPRLTFEGGVGVLCRLDV